MSIPARTIEIIIEACILTGIAYVILNGVKLTIFDLGVSKKYSKVVVMMLFTVGIIFMVFLVAHLVSFYPV